MYITFGSVAGGLDHVAGVLEAALEAVAGLDVTATLTTGRDFDLSRLATVPPNVTVEAWLNQRVEMAGSVAVVCHGGGGTVLPEWG